MIGSRLGRYRIFRSSTRRRHLVRSTMPGGAAILAASAVLLCGSAAAHSGPCTAQIAQLEQQINAILPGPESGPTAPQSVGAQLHHQPTPQTVERGERTANKDADAALDRAKKADANGDAAGCAAALKEARRLYDIK